GGLWTFGPSAMAAQIYGADTVRRMKHEDQADPMVIAYTTRDGRQIYFLPARSEKQFEAFAEMLGHKELLEDPRFSTAAARRANARECIKVLDKIFAERDLKDWLPRLEKLLTPWALVQSSAEAGKDPQTIANGYLMTVEGKGGKTYPVAATPAQF